MTSGAEIAVALAGTGAVVRPAGPPDSVGGVEPLCVASPATLDQAAGVLAAAAGLDMAVVPRGSGRTISWGLPPARCDVIADLSGMTQILEYAAGDLVVRAEAGVTLGQLAETLAEKGQRLVLDGPPGATVGGVVARNSAGPLRLRYGLPRDLLIGITIVRADGHVAKAGGKVVKNVAGYDLGKLFAGSAGTLGLIAGVTFRLHPRPDLSAWVTEKYQGSAAAAEAALAAAASPLQPSAVELARPRVGGPLWVSTLLEGTPSGVSARAGRMRVALGHGASEAMVAPDWWGAIGEAAPGPVDGTLVRVAFWAAELRPVLDAIDAVAADTGVAAAVGGSAGAGVLYASVGAGEDPEQVAVFVRALRAAIGPASGPGADGPARGSARGPARGSVVVLTAPAAVRERVDLWGPVPSLALMRSVKQQFDPGNLMAPGRGPGGI
ncbi:MAG TPA: FAD-binding oxidoreductase [Streptosporangiaceae bacterium]